MMVKKTLKNQDNAAQSKEEIKYEFIEENSTDADAEIIPLESLEETPPTEDYISRENDTVRIYTYKKQILPGVYIDTKSFKVFLTDNKDSGSYLMFREPDTGECLESIRKNQERLAENTKKGASKSSTAMESELELLKFICSLSIGKIDVTISLLRSLPIKYQYRITRTIEYITESQGTKISL